MLTLSGPYAQARQAVCGNIVIPMSLSLFTRDCLLQGLPCCSAGVEKPNVGPCLDFTSNMV